MTVYLILIAFFILFAAMMFDAALDR